MAERPPHLISYNDPEIRRLRDLNILTEVHADEIPTENGLILVSCSDKNRFHDIFSHLGSLCGEKIHAFAWHGGGLRLTADSPTNETSISFDRHALAEIRDAVNVVANTTTIVLLVHLPCGKARLANMTWQEVFSNLCASKWRLKSEFAQKVNVLTLVHIHYWDNETGDEKMRTYFLDPHRWMEDPASGWSASLAS